MTVKIELDEFTVAYIRAALWSSMDNCTPQGGEPLNKNHGIEDVSQETLARMEDDCDKFRRKAARELTQGEKDWNDIFTREDDERAGHDFWLTRNGHGAGFWDGDWPKEIGETLTKASKQFGTFDLEVGDDGKIYGS